MRAKDSFSFSLVGCAPMSLKMKHLSIGMTKAEAIEVLGTPSSMTANGGMEYLSYRLTPPALDSDRNDTADYFVRIVNGRVDDFGRRRDSR